MNPLERQVVEAVSAYLAQAAASPGPSALAQLIATAISAVAGPSACVLTVADQRFQWGDATGPWLWHPVSYDGEPQGTLAVAPESVGPLPAVAAMLGAPFAMLRLAADVDGLLREGDAAARQLADDRWRAAVELEQERRALERDLHDGAQHHLVALRMSLALVENAAEHAESTVGERLADLLSKLDTAQRVLVDTAAGVLPIALATDGLAAALSAELAGHDDVALDTGDLRRRHPPVVETAVYFVCLEAVNNARKHAAGARVTVTVRDGPGGLECTVSDTGPGFGHGPVLTSGLHNLSARIGAVGGTVEVRSVPGTGTTVTGFVPR
jgi:signal transduction histidine kinase